MKDRMLITPLLFLQVVWESVLDWHGKHLAQIGLTFMVIGFVCSVLVVIFTLLDYAWGI